MPFRSPLTVKQILAWADAHHARTGRWPTAASGKIVGAVGENWRRINLALYLGYRGLRGGSSLARLLDEHRGDRVRGVPLTVEQILAWADAHRRRTGAWPTAASGPVADAPGTTWRAVNLALYHGSRGLRAGDSLSRLLDRERRRIAR